jgi:cytochrome d ubiquinol oxidase subunit II
MSLVDLVAALMFIGVVAYGLFGGADYGSGVWDLLAGDAEHGAALRTQVDHSIGPVWEANHVWLVYVLVFMWSAFPTGFAAVMNSLWVPWMLVGLGIVLRGSGFAFRKYSEDLARARLFGGVFALSSIITPFFLGMIAGAVASGRVTLDGPDDLSVWTGPTSWVGGVLAVGTSAYLAAVYLAADAHRAGHDELAEYCAKRGIWSGVITGVMALAAVPLLTDDAATLTDRLQGRAAPLAVASALSGAGAILLLYLKRYSLARVGATAAVGTVLLGWGVAQWPDFLVDHATLDEVAGARPTQIALVIVFGLAAITAVPALVWLLYLVNRREQSLQS